MTLAASTGPGQPRIAGTARPVVLPLWVGPTTTTRLGRFGRQAGGREHARAAARGARRPGGGRVGGHHAGAAGRAAGPSGRRGAAGAGPAARAPARLQEKPATRARRPRRHGEHDGRRGSPAAGRHGGVGVDDRRSAALSGAAPGTTAGPPSTGRCPAAAGAAARSRWPTATAARPPPRARPATARRRPGSPSPPAGPGPAPPARSPTPRPNAGRTPGAAPPRWRPRRRATASTTTAASGPRRGWTGSPRPRRPPGRSLPAVRRRDRCGGPGQRRLQPGGGARHQDAERGRRVQRRQIEDDQRRREVQARRGRPVEHAPQIAVHQPAQLQRDVTPVLEQVARLGAQRTGRVGGRAPAAPRPPTGTVGTVRRPGRLGQRRAERGPLAGHQFRPEAGAGQRGQQLHPPAPASSVLAVVIGSASHRDPGQAG